MRRCISILALILSLSLAITGCSRAPSADDFDKEKKHMLNVVSLAGQYHIANKKHASSIDELKAWAIKEGKAAEEDFISTRDKQPYGLALGMGVIVFETAGKRGQCYLWQAGAFREVPQAQTEEMAKSNAKAMAARRGPAGGMQAGGMQAGGMQAGGMQAGGMQAGGMQAGGMQQVGAKKR